MTTVIDGLRVEVGLGSTPATPLASIAWTDVTSDVLLPRSVTFNRGRGSQESGATPGRLTLTLNNGQASGKSVGRWTRGGSNCTAGWGLRVPIRVRHTTHGGLWLGYVDAANPSWENGVRPVVEVSATDRLGRFQQRKLTSLATGEVLYDDPAAFFPLSEAATSATVGDASGNQAGTLGLITCGSPTNASFEMGSAEVPGGDGITSAGFVPDNDRNGYALAGDLAGMPSIGYFGVLARIGTAPSGSRTTLVQLRDAMGLSWWIGLDSGGYPEIGTSQSPTPATATDAIPAGRWVHLGARYSGGAITLYVDGTAVAVVAGISMTPVRIFVGGTNKPTATGYHHAFTGNLANVALFSTALDGTRRAAHGASSDGFAGDTAVERFQRICRVAGLAAADYTTTSTSLTVPPGNSAPSMGEQPTDGRPFLDAVQECADVERGVAYMAPDGVLTLQRGAFRFNQAVALTLAPKDVDSSTSIDDDLDRLVNDVTVRRPGGADQRVVNQASVDAYDTHNETLEIAAADDTQALAVAAWKVADEGTPQPRVDSVAVDAVAKASTVAASSLLTVPQSGRVQLTPMPTPASHSSTVDLLADGFTDRVTESSWLRTMTTSSATNYSNIWLWDTATEKFDTGGVLY